MVTHSPLRIDDLYSPVFTVAGWARDAASFWHGWLENEASKLFTNGNAINIDYLFLWEEGDVYLVSCG